MFRKKFTVLFSVLGILSSPLMASPNLQVDCEVVSLKKFISYDLTKKDQGQINALLAPLNLNLSESRLTTQEKGIIGETVAKHTFPMLRNQQYVSLVDSLKDRGCSVQPFLRNRSDQGIDDIFVAINDNAIFQPNVDPIIHEAKYNSNCQLKLDRTKHSCQQLSIQWITKNLEQAKKRTNQVEICFQNNDGEEESIRIEACAGCQKDFQDVIGWLKDKISHGYYQRMASVYCPDAKTINFYQ